MTVRDLLDEKPMWEGSTLTEKLLKGPLYAKRARDGKRLFDTRHNKRGFVERYFDWEVIAIWPDFQPDKGISFSQYPYIVPVIGCYIKEPREEVYAWTTNLI